MQLNTLLSFIVLFWLLTCTPANAQLKLPPTPGPGQLVQDYADIISVDDKEKIRVVQYQSYESDNTPICVVTIPSKQTFGGGNVSIEKIAHDLFDKWQIGKRNAEGRLINQGILLLVSVGDRKARIELGADWGRDWDGHCDKIMNRVIIPEFKNGDYSAGIRAGVERLALMGKSGPAGAAPFSLADEIKEPMLEGLNPIPRWAGILLIAVGLGLVVLGVLIPKYQKPLILTGIGLMMFALLFYLAVIVLAALFDHKNGNSSGSSWSGGGGFSSGGFSGGGGSTGSW